jgi:aryl-alcohol dehydrogenase-like predicted oxidoreductase
MKAAYDVGINFFDCAEEYSGGESEKAMGQAIKKYGWKRNDLVISTKVIMLILVSTKISSARSVDSKHRSTGAKLSAKILSTTLVSLGST